MDCRKTTANTRPVIAETETIEGPCMSAGTDLLRIQHWLLKLPRPIYFALGLRTTGLDGGAHFGARVSHSCWPASAARGGCRGCIAHSSPRPRSRPTFPVGKPGGCRVTIRQPRPGPRRGAGPSRLGHGPPKRRDIRGVRPVGSGEQELLTPFAPRPEFGACDVVRSHGSGAIGL